MLAINGQVNRSVKTKIETLTLIMYNCNGFLRKIAEVSQAVNFGTVYLDSKPQRERILQFGSFFLILLPGKVLQFEFRYDRLKRMIY